jgi:hypothetical protein
MYRQPTKDEELAAWHRLAFQLNLHRTITLDNSKIVECLTRIDSWVAAHGDANGERSEAAIKANVARAFWKFIAVMEPEPAPKRGRKPKNGDQ